MCARALTTRPRSPHPDPGPQQQQQQQASLTKSIPFDMCLSIAAKCLRLSWWVFAWFSSLSSCSGVNLFAKDAGISIWPAICGKRADEGDGGDVSSFRRPTWGIAQPIGAAFVAMSGTVQPSIKQQATVLVGMRVQQLTKLCRHVTRNLDNGLSRVQRTSTPGTGSLEDRRNSCLLEASYASDAHQSLTFGGS